MLLQESQSFHFLDMSSLNMNDILRKEIVVSFETELLAPNNSLLNPPSPS